MKVLLDESAPRIIQRRLPDLAIRTVQEIVLSVLDEIKRSVIQATPGTYVEIPMPKEG